MSSDASVNARDPLFERYSRQILFEPFGLDGQRRVSESQVTLVGCGALGSVIATILVRAGVGSLRLVDRDVVELSNLQRQTLYDEQDVADAMPKAVAAANKLARVNSLVRLDPRVVDCDRTNVESLVGDAHVVLDGTDNFETRFLLNDACVKHNIPWVYGACVSATGMVMPILPGQTPCLRCIWDEPPPPGISPTCDTAGVLGSVVHVVAALQANEALKLLAGKPNAVSRRLLQIDVWTGRFDSFDLGGASEQTECTCCRQRRFEYLAGTRGGGIATLCGRNAVQIAAPVSARIDLGQVAARVGPLAATPPRLNRFLLRFRIDDYDVTLFTDGRAIIQGAVEPDEARTVYAKYIGA